MVCNFSEGYSRTHDEAETCLFQRRQAEINHVNKDNCTDCYNSIKPWKCTQ